MLQLVGKPEYEADIRLGLNVPSIENRWTISAIHEPQLLQLLQATAGHSPVRRSAPSPSSPIEARSRTVPWDCVAAAFLVGKKERRV